MSRIRELQKLLEHVKTENDVRKFKAALRRHIKLLRAENDLVIGAGFDIENKPNAQGYEEALDRILEFLDVK